jgi:ribosomal protein S21
MLCLILSMATNAKIEKTNNESSAYLLRKFVRKVQGTGLTQIMRARRYFERPKSSLRMKRSAMHRMNEAKKYDELRKLGKIN